MTKAIPAKKAPPVLAWLAPLALCVAAFGSPATRPATQPALLAHVDHRMELMSIIFQLAGNTEYGSAIRSPYAKAVETHFAPFRDYPAVQTARRLGQKRGVSYDAVASLAIHVSDAVGLGERIPFDHADCRLESRWQPAEARDFLEKARAFVKDTGFEAFMAGHEAYFAAAAGHMNELLARVNCLAWFDSFFGPRPDARYEVIVGLLTNGGNYGCSVRLADGSEEITPVIGVWRADRGGVPQFRRDVVPILVHEFCHSYSNRLVDRHARQMEPAARRIFATCEQVMSQQAYGHWETLLYESMVRACVVRYVRASEGQASARAEIRRQYGRGFEWVGELSELLEEYEKNRDRYPTLEAFMPKVIAFFEEYAPKAETRHPITPKRSWWPLRALSSTSRPAPGPAPTSAVDQ